MSLWAISVGLGGAAGGALADPGGIDLAPQVLEVHQQIAGRLVSPVNLFCQQLERDAFQFGGNVIIETGDRVGLSVDHIVQDFTQIGPGKRRFAP